MTIQRLVDLSMFQVNPPLSGGPAAVHYLLESLTQKYDVQCIAYVPERRLEGEVKHSYGLHFRPWGGPAASILQMLEERYQRSLPKFACGDIVSRFDAASRKWLGNLITSKTLVMLEQPFLIHLLPRIEKLPILLRAHNVEWVYWNDRLGRGTFKHYLMDYVHFIERNVAGRAACILAMSNYDKLWFQRLYSVPSSKIEVVPPCIDTRNFHPQLEEERENLKSRLGLSGPVCIYISSVYAKYNLKGAHLIIDNIAQKLRNVRFLIVGQVCDELPADVPHNVKCIGRATEETKRDLLEASDVGLYPVSLRTGFPIKMLEYLAAGLPVITTESGAQACRIKDGVHGVVCDESRFVRSIELILNDDSLRLVMRRNARALAESMFDVRLEGNRVQEILERISRSQPVE